MGRRGNRLLWRTLAWGTYNPGTEVSPGAGDLRALLEGRPVVGGGSEPIRSLLAPGAIPHAPGLLHYAAGAGLHVLLYRTSRFDLEESRRRTPILGTALACRVPAVGESSRGIRRWYRPDGALRRRKAAAGADLASVCPALRADAHASRPDPLRVELLRLPSSRPDAEKALLSGVGRRLGPGALLDRLLSCNHGPDRLRRHRGRARQGSRVAPFDGYRT